MACALALIWSTWAGAQDGEPTSTGLADDLLSFDEMVIEGEVQTPLVVVVISRGNLNKAYDFELEESFLVRIVEVLGRPPF
jgi:hypothetical protein